MSEQKPIVIYHANCIDGFTAAWACWLKHPDWEFYPAKHGDPPPDVTGRVVYMLDFSYKRDVILEMNKTAQYIVVIDHHKTAQAELESIEGIENSHVWVVFNMDKSGARLAWEFFHYEAPPELVLYVEDRDLWRFNLKFTKEVNANLFSYPYDFNVYSEINKKLEESNYGVVEAGEAILRKHNKDVEELCQNSYKLTIGGHEVPTVNLPYTFASEAGHLLGKGQPFAATYYFDGKNFIFSLRSEEDGLDVSEVAKMYGGGGHKHAAGFKVSSLIDLHQHHYKYEEPRCSA